VAVIASEIKTRKSDGADNGNNGKCKQCISAIRHHKLYGRLYKGERGLSEITNDKFGLDNQEFG
jgi:hypothetical protein